MTEPNSAPAPSPAPARIRSRDTIVALGVGATGLLYHLLRAIGAEAVLGGLPTALVAFFGMALLWLLAAMDRRIRRPVVTIAVGGGIAGALAVAASMLLGEWPEADPPVTAFAVLLEIAKSAALGALIGWIGSGIRARRRR